jgi:hypothetical protein
MPLILVKNMIIKEKAKKYILENLNTNVDAIYINISNDCCSVGNSIHIGFVNSNDFKNYLIVNNIKVCYLDVNYDLVNNLIIDYNNIGFTYEEIK